MMDVKSYNVVSLPDTIGIGRRTETGVLSVRIDCTGWKTFWPKLTLSLWVTPPGGSASYRAATHMDGNVLVWDVSNVDTATAGIGSVEVVGVATEQKKLSAIAKTQVLDTTTAETSDPPEVLQTWVDKLNETISEAEAATAEAEAAAEEARNAANGEGGTGTAGVSPTIDVSKSGKVTTLTITDVEGTETVKIYDGDDGAAGKDGVSTTHSWNGTTLTVTSASGTSGADLKGDKGDKGDIGATGATGPQGEKGDTGVGVSGMQQTVFTTEDSGVNEFTISTTDGQKATLLVTNGSKGSAGKDGVGIESCKQVVTSGADGGNNVVEITLTDGTVTPVTIMNGSKGGTGATGATGARGSSVLRVTTAPSSYTTATGGFTPTYRIALNTVLTQSKSADAKIGDTLIYSYYTYPVGYVDASYVYLGARTSIRGSTGSAGAAGVGITGITIVEV